MDFMLQGAAPKRERWRQHCTRMTLAFTDDILLLMPEG
jgi:hypothetical protein